MNFQFFCVVFALTAFCSATQNEITCGEPPVIPFASVTNIHSTKKYVVGTIVAYKCEPGYAIKGRSTIAQCVLSADAAHGEWTTALMSCTEITCDEPPVIPFASVRNLQLSQKYVLGATVAYECEPGYDITGRSTTARCILSTDEAHGQWTRVFMSCTERPTSSSSATTSASSQFTPVSTAITTESPTVTPLRPTRRAHQTLIEESSNSTERDSCSCTFAPEIRQRFHFRNISPESEIKVRKGGIVTFSCNDSAAMILFWKNGLRVHGSANLICASCRRWEDRDVPKCMELREGEPFIILNPKMKLVPGGIIKIGQNESLELQCSTRNINNLISVPEWKSPQCHKPIYNILPDAKGGYQISVSISINRFTAELRGQYECRVKQCDHNNTSPTSLFLEMADQCIIPAVEKGKVRRYETRRYGSRFYRQFVEFRTEDKINSGETIILLCNDGFIPKERSQAASESTSEQQVTCEYGNWSKSLECISASCNGEPPPIENGFPVILKRTHKHIIFYICYRPYEKIQTGHVECFHGTWRGTTPKCGHKGTTCPWINVSSNLNFWFSNYRHVGSKAHFRCSYPYDLIGSSVLECLSSGKWNNTEPSCEIRCPALDEKDTFVITYHNERRVGSNAYYVCKDPTWKTIGPNVRNCQTNKRWSGFEPKCTAPECHIEDLMQSLPKGVVPNEDDLTGEVLLIGEELRLLCDDKNKILIGSKIARCTQAHVWEVGNPECIRGCHLNARSLSSTLIIDSVKDYYRFGESIELSCPDGQELTVDVEIIMCMGQEWSDPLPDCKNLEV